MKKTVIIKRAVPGSGKTTISNSIAKAIKAKNLKIGIHSTDNYFMENNVYKFDVEKLEKYHKKNLQDFTKDLINQVDLVICDNTNLSSWQSEPYTDAARKYNYQIIFIDYPPREPEKHFETQIITPEKPDAHGVPPEDILAKIEEYHKHKNLLDKNSKIDPEINIREIWDDELNDIKKSTEILKHYDLDFLITIQPDEYHEAKTTIGEKILEIMEV